MFRCRPLDSGAYVTVRSGTVRFPPSHNTKPMKRIRSSSRSTQAGALVLALALHSTAARGEALFDFDNGNPLDGAGVGGSMTVLDPAESINVTLTNVEIVGQNGSLASDGVEANVTNSTPNDALGVFSTTDLSGNPNNDRDFDPGEQWIFSFDVDVNLVVMDFAGWGPNESEITLSFSDSTPDMVFTDTTNTATFDLADTPISAGTTITMELTNTSGDQAVRLRYFTVAAVPAAPTGDNLVWAGGDGGNWNTTEANFTGDDTVFSTGDNVTIQTLGSINIDAGGITAGTVMETAGAGTVPLQNGNLTTTGFEKSGASLLTLVSPMTLDTGTGVISLSDGTLQISNGASLLTSSVALSGGAILQVDSGGTFTATGGGAIATGGATVQTEEPVSLDDLPTSIDGDSETIEVFPLTKSGAGVLTLTGGLGIQTQGPIDLDILGGSVAATGDNQLNIGGTNVWDGDLTMEATDLEFHGSTVSGAGSIIVQSGSATLNGRFNGGEVNIANAIVLDSDLTVDSPTGDSELHLNGVISGAANLLKGGNGIVVLTGANDYTGTTTVNAGTLRIGSGGNLGEGNVTLNIPNNGNTGTLEFQCDDAIMVPNLISGEGNLIVTCGPAGSVEIANDTDYTGITTIAGGTLVASYLDDANLPSSIGAADGTAGTLILKGGATLSYTGAGASTDREFSLGGTVNGGATGGGTISADGGPLEFTFPGVVGGDGGGTAPRILTLAGSASEPSTMALEITDGIASIHSVVKSGSTTWELTGDNSYTGNTTVEEGTLILAVDSLDDFSTVSIAAGAVLDLTHGEGDTVDALFLDGVQVAAGSYGGTASAAVTKDNDHFNPLSTGYLIVTSDPVATDYDAWAGMDGYNLTGGMDDDDDNDGLTNKEEYAFGLDPTSGASVSPVTAPKTGTFTYTRRNPAIYSTGLTYSYGSSTTLVGAFDPFVPASENGDGGDPIETVTVTIPADLLENPSLFVQVTAQ